MSAPMRDVPDHMIAASLRSALEHIVCTANREVALPFMVDLLQFLDRGTHQFLTPIVDAQNHHQRAGARGFPARYRGKCDLCACSIEVDDMVVKSAPPRRGVDHVGCADRPNPRLSAAGREAIKNRKDDFR